MSNSEPEIVHPTREDGRCSVVIFDKVGGIPIYSRCLEHRDGDSTRLSCWLAIMELLEKFKMRVRDVNFDRLQSYKISSRLFRAKHRQLETLRNAVCHDKGCPCVDLLPKCITEVTMNCSDVLDALAQQLGLDIGRIEVHCFTDGQFVAWVSVPRCRLNERREWIISKQCSNSAAAKEDVARVAISTLELIYDFEVADISYFLLPPAYEEYYNEMEAYYKAERELRAAHDHNE